MGGSGIIVGVCDVPLLFLPNEIVFECHIRTVYVFRLAILALLFLPCNTVGRPERFDSGLTCPFTLLYTGTHDGLDFFLLFDFCF